MGMWVREGLKTCRRDPPPHHIHLTHTHDHSPSLQIIALSAAPVRQTVRGSLGGVPQGSAIGLLEKAPPYRTPTVRVQVKGRGL